MSDTLLLLSKAIAVVAPSLSAASVSMWAAALIPQMQAAGINTPNRAAAFIGQVSVETGGFRELEENLCYTAARLCAVWPCHFPDEATAEACAANPVALAEKVYGGRMGNTQPGDGWRFRGRGLIQLTGRANYAAFGASVNMTAENAATYLTTAPGATAAAIWFWTKHDLNHLADGWCITAITRVINGGTNALADRIRLSNRALAALGG